MVDYSHQIKPLFASKCATCHGALKQKSGLRLDTGSLAVRGANDGAVIVPGDAEASLILRKVTAADPEERMPPEGEGAPLTDAQVELLRAWIDQGATHPADEPMPEDPRDHWAYRPPQRPQIPASDDKAKSLATSGNPIDAFIAARHSSRGLTPAPFADAGTWLRRVSLDLVGLPPTPEQRAAFVTACAQGEAAAAAARRQAIDRLLASRHYGERWGRHWMDVWRYSDWEGFKNQLRGSQRHIWRWRDWIVESLNVDKGYDRMLMEMLAGDELAPVDPDTLRATGFLARNYHHSNRNIWLDNTVEHTFKAFMGVTINCTRCHDHKYDPIEQPAYYRLRAVFEPHNVRTDRVGNQANLLTDGLARAYDKEPDAVTHLYIRGSEKDPDQDNPMTPAVPPVFGGQLNIKPVSLPLEAYYPSLTEARRAAALKAAQNAVSRAEKALAGAEGKEDSDRVLLGLKKEEAVLALASLEARVAAEVARYVDHNKKLLKKLTPIAADAERAHGLAKAKRVLHEKQAALDKARAAQDASEAADPQPAADAKKTADALAAAKKALADSQKALETARDAIDKADSEYSPLGDVYPRTSTGRRTALARWFVSRRNPLTARVAVNHIWLRHFGAPLVENVFDFGLRSPEPKHRALLDWLAVELVDRGWSMKHLHRLIVSSDAYRLASVEPRDRVAAANRAIDPDNLELWHANARRLDAETVRDSVLYVAGGLDTTAGGAPVPYQEADASPRRSVYLQHAYEKQSRFMQIFDAASVNECYRRSASVIPQQALAMANSALVLSQARRLAAELTEQTDADNPGRRKRAFVHDAFMRILSRPPTDEESDYCVTFLREQAKRLAASADLTPFVGGADAKVTPSADPDQRARENLVHVLMNHHDFVTTY
jgi:hypothetical protein